MKFKPVSANQPKANASATPIISVNCIFFSKLFKSKDEHKAISAGFLETGNKALELAVLQSDKVFYLKEAANFFTTAIRNDRSSIDARIGRAKANVALLELVSPDNAHRYYADVISDCEKIFRLDPKNAALPEIVGNLIDGVVKQELSSELLYYIAEKFKGKGVVIPHTRLYRSYLG